MAVLEDTSATLRTRRPDLGTPPWQTFGVPLYLFWAEVGVSANIDAELAQKGPVLRRVSTLEAAADHLDLGEPPKLRDPAIVHANKGHRLWASHQYT